MQSPFASSTLSFDWMDNSGQDMKMSHIIQYVQFNSYLSSSPERTQSMPSFIDKDIEIKYLKKHHMHRNNLGVLMVQDKKPFRVRFNKN